MAKYEQLAANLKTNLTSAQNILIALPINPEVDHLAAGLALFLSLQTVNKKVSIVSDSIIRVGHTNLFGVDQVKTTIESENGDFILSLGGVVQYDSLGKAIVPALQELTWHPSGGDLDLVFKVTPGQKFAPTHITPKPTAGGYDLIFVIGAQSLQGLGGVYSQNPQIFSGQVVNIDRVAANTQFGAVNIVDPQANSLSEVVGLILPSLGLNLSSDIATNILTGIYQATANLQTATADTFEAVAQALKVGGSKPTTQVSPQPSAFAQAFSQPIQPQPQTAIPQTTSLPWVQDNFTVPPVVNSQAPQPSPEEVPGGERVTTETPEPDWLTPKIFKGTNLN